MLSSGQGCWTSFPSPGIPRKVKCTSEHGQNAFSLLVATVRDGSQLRLNIYEIKKLP